jgi:hypothetical protein
MGLDDPNQVKIVEEIASCAQVGTIGAKPATAALDRHVRELPSSQLKRPTTRSAGSAKVPGVGHPELRKNWAALITGS